jgi:hypothetical protein
MSDLGYAKGYNYDLGVCMYEKVESPWSNQSDSDTIIMWLPLNIKGQKQCCLKHRHNTSTYNLNNKY